MKIIDDISAILSDGSVINFYEDGSGETFLSDSWKKRYRNSKFKFPTKKMAIKVWEKVNEILEKERKELVNS